MDDSLGVAKEDEFLAHEEEDFGSDEGDEVLDERKHAKLLEAIGSLDGKRRINLAQRTELAPQVSEYHVSSTNRPVRLHELVGALQKSASHGELKKQMNRVQKQQKVLNVPLPKPEQERIERSVAYEKISDEVSKWDPVVHQNRKAEQLKFPLTRPDLKVHNATDQVVKGFKPYSSLEKEVATLLQDSPNTLPNEKALTPAEEKALRAMSIEEAKDRRAELQKYRALLSYKEAKSRRQKKIKSKRYHRALRKEKQKKDKGAMEELQKNDPEEYLQRLTMIEKERMQERMSLKHRGGSKFSRTQTMYGKYNTDTRQAVQDMLQKSRALSQKMTAESESDDEAASDDAEATGDGDTEAAGGGVSNPWMSSVVKKKPAAASSRYTKPSTVVNNACDTLEQEVEQCRHDGQSDEVKLKATKDKSKSKKDADKKDEKMEESDAGGDDDSDDDVDIDTIFDAMESAVKSAQSKAAPPSQSSKSEASRNPKCKGKTSGSMTNSAPKSRRQKRRMRETESDSESETVTSSDEGSDSERGKDEEDEGEREEMMNMSLQRRKTLDDFETNWPEMDAGRNDVNSKTLSGVEVSNSSAEQIHRKAKGDNKPIQVDPKKFLQIAHKITKEKHVNIVEDESDAEEEDDQRLTIAQAFASDDVIEEFVQEKKVAIEKDQPKDVDLTLPGWGEWGGAGVQLSKRKKKRFTIKAPEAPARRDRDLDNVIISQTKDHAVAKHQVNTLPFPHSSVQQFESSIRQPIGKTWNTEVAYKKLIKPKVVTKMGTVIQPIDKNEVFKKQQQPQPGKKDWEAGKKRRMQDRNDGGRTSRGGQQRKRTKQK